MDAAQKWMKTFSNQEIKEGSEAVALAFQDRSRKGLGAAEIAIVSIRLRRECARRGYNPSRSAPNQGRRP